MIRGRLQFRSDAGLLAFRQEPHRPQIEETQPVLAGLGDQLAAL